MEDEWIFRSLTGSSLLDYRNTNILKLRQSARNFAADVVGTVTPPQDQCMYFK